MRVKRLTTWLVLGISVALAYTARRRRGGPRRRAVPAVPVPAGAREAPAASAEIDASALGRGDEAGDVFVEAIAEWDEPGGAARADVYRDRRAARGAGDLYGVHVATAADRELPDDDQAQAEGENWLEHLETTSAELGPEPEHAIDVIDDSDPHPGHHKTATRDTPVADRGSGGPRGL